MKNNQATNTGIAKEAYQKPVLKEIALDNEISFVLASEPPFDPWGKIETDKNNDSNIADLF